jgi:hypothetical protein
MDVHMVVPVSMGMAVHGAVGVPVLVIVVVIVIVVVVVVMAVVVGRFAFDSRLAVAAAAGRAHGDTSFR